MESKTLQDQLIEHFLETPSFTAKDVYEWYKTIKTGRSTFTYYSSIFSLIIYPMLEKGIIERVSHGNYRLTALRALVKKDQLAKQNTQTKTNTPAFPSEQEDKIEDELDAFLNEKLK